MIHQPVWYTSICGRYDRAVQREQTSEDYGAWYCVYSMGLIFYTLHEKKRKVVRMALIFVT